MTRVARLPDGHLWLRVTRPYHDDPFDPSFARQSGGRWNPPGAFDTLYLDRDLDTARLQIARMLEGYPGEAADLADDAYELVGCRLPDAQDASTCILAPASLPSAFR